MRSHAQRGEELSRGKSALPAGAQSGAEERGSPDPTRAFLQGYRPLCRRGALLPRGADCPARLGGSRRRIASARTNTQLRLEKARLERLDQAGRLAQEELNELDGRIDPDLFPKTRDELYISHQEAFVFTRNGVHQRTKWGVGQTVRGVDSLRGYIVSATPYLYIEIFLDGQLIYKSDLVVAPLRHEKSNPEIKKYVYNAWIDFSNFSLGQHELVFRAVNVRGDAREGIDWRREQIIIAEPPADAFLDSDAVIPPLERIPRYPWLSKSTPGRASSTPPRHVPSPARSRMWPFFARISWATWSYPSRRCSSSARYCRTHGSPAYSARPTSRWRAAWEFSTRSSCSTSPITRISGSGLWTGRVRRIWPANWRLTSLTSR